MPVPYGRFNGNAAAIDAEIGYPVGDALLHRRAAHQVAEMRERGFVVEFQQITTDRNFMWFRVSWPGHDGSGETEMFLPTEW